MKHKQFEECISILEKEYDEIQEKIKKLSNKIQILKYSSIKNKLERILSFSIVPFFMTFMVLALTNLNNTSLSFSLNEVSLIATLMSTSSLTIGLIANNLLEKKYKVKERLKSFSNSKTNKEKIKETIEYEIEKEQLINRNKVIKETINTLQNEKDMIESLSNKYNIGDSKYAKLSLNDLKESIKELEKIISIRLYKIDLTTEKKEINIFQEKISNTSIVFYSMLTFALSLVLLNIPYMMFAFGTFPPFTLSILPTIICTVVYTTIACKLKSDNKKVYLELKKDLEKNYENINLNNDNNSLNYEIEKGINTISTYKAELEKQKNMLNTMQNQVLLEQKKDFYNTNTYDNNLEYTNNKTLTKKIQNKRH